MTATSESGTQRMDRLASYIVEWCGRDFQELSHPSQRTATNC